MDEIRCLWNDTNVWMLHHHISQPLFALLLLHTHVFADTHGHTLIHVEKRATLTTITYTLLFGSFSMKLAPNFILTQKCVHSLLGGIPKSIIYLFNCLHTFLALPSNLFCVSASGKATGNDDVFHRAFVKMIWWNTECPSIGHQMHIILRIFATVAAAAAIRNKQSTKIAWLLYFHCIYVA